MAEYRVTIDLTTRLRGAVDADSAEQAEQVAETMYQEYIQGQTTHMISKGRHVSVEFVSAGSPHTHEPLQ